MRLRGDHISLDLTSILFAVLVTLPCINYYIGEIYWAFDLLNPYAEYIYAVVYVAGVIAIVKNFTSFKAVSIVVLLLLLGYSVFVTPRAVPEYTGPDFLRSPLAQFLFIFFPVFLLASDKKFDYEGALNLLSYCAAVPLVLMLVAFVFQTMIVRTGLHEYMTFAYMALPMILVLMYYSWTSKTRVIGKVLSVLASLTVLFGGCRGALLTLIAFIALSILLFSKNRLRRIVAIIIGMFIVLNLSSILNFLGGQLNTIGVESRIFAYIETGEMGESDTRMEVYKKALSIISVYGHGIYSDRYLLEGVEDASYCHNWMLEFFVDYGWPVGGLLVLLVIYKIASIIKETSAESSQSQKFMLYLAISMLGVKFMLSNSYLNSFEIALIFGWLIFLTRIKGKWKPLVTPVS